jgi:hypothetical protein
LLLRLIPFAVRFDHTLFISLFQVRKELNEAREHSIAMRHDDIKALKAKVEQLQEQAKFVDDLTDPVMVDMFRFIKLIANHEAAIKEIVEQRSKLVSYEKTHHRTSLTLQLGVMAKVPRSFLSVSQCNIALQLQSSSTGTASSSSAFPFSTATAASLSSSCLPSSSSSSSSATAATTAAAATAKATASTSSPAASLSSVRSSSASFSFPQENEEFVSLVWTIEPMGHEVAAIRNETTTESTFEELPVVNGVIQTSAAFLVTCD